jgi:hypothetical protein
MLGTQEGAGQVGLHDAHPLLVGQILERDAAGRNAGVVEQQVDPAVGLFHRREQGGDRCRVGDVGRHDEGARRRRVRQARRLFQHVLAAPGQHDIPAGLQQGMRRGAADAAAGAGDDGDLPVFGHGVPLQSRRGQPRCW